MSTKQGKVNSNISLILKKGIAVDVNYVVSKVSETDYNSVIKYCLDRKVRLLRILGLAKQGKAVRNWEKVKLSILEEADLIEKINDLAESHGMSVEFVGLPNQMRCSHSDLFGRCLGGREFFHVNTNGDIYPCPSTKSLIKRKIGSVFDPDNTFFNEQHQACMAEEQQALELGIDSSA